MPEQVPDGAIVITPAQMYESTQQSVGKIATDLSDLKTILSPVPATLADHEARIRKLERALWIGVGIAAAAGSAVGTAASSLLGS